VHMPLQPQDSIATTSSPSGAPIVVALRKQWLIGVIVIASALSAAAFFTIGTTRIYRATASIQIDPNPPQPLGRDVQAVMELGAGSYWSNKEYFSTQLEILKGLSLVSETVRALGLQNDMSFINDNPPGHEPPTKKKSVELDEAAIVLRSRLTVEAVRESRLVNVKITDANPERARRILSTLLDIYLERNVSRAVAATGSATQWLGGQMVSLKDELEKSELALHEYKKEKRILSVSLDDQSNMLRGEMQQLSQALTAVNARREALLARARELEKVDPNDVTSLPASELLSSSLLSNLRQDYVHAKADVESLLGAGKGENYPGVEAGSARVEATRQALMAEVKNVQGALQGDLTAVAREAQGLSRLFELAKQRAMDLNMLEIEYHRLERSKNNTEKLFGIVLERSKESDLTGMMRFNNISIVESPTTEKAPIKPKPLLNLAIGLLMGLVLGGAAALGREWVQHRTIRSPDDVEEGLGVPVMGVIPSLTGKVSRAGYYYSRQPRHDRGLNSIAPTLGDGLPVELTAHSVPASNAAECARGIRTSLTFSSPDNPYRTILVTSANPSEGKTMVATTIAVAFAQAGQKVLLVDCDLRRSRLHRIFKLTNAAGVSSVLQDISMIDSAAMPTVVPNLSLLAAGPHVPNPAELLQSASFERMLAALAERFDRVIIDSPPVLAVTDAAILGSRVDGAVVVARAKRTRREVARQVVKKMKDLGANVTGIVLNGIDEPRHRGGYYYGYYSREGYGTGSEGEKAS
jgi:polysaccharide biosynthesis transport protein